SKTTEIVDQHFKFRPRATHSSTNEISSFFRSTLKNLHCLGQCSLPVAHSNFKSATLKVSALSSTLVALLPANDEVPTRTRLFEGDPNSVPGLRRCSPT